MPKRKLRNGFFQQKMIQVKKPQFYPLWLNGGSFLNNFVL